MAQNIMFAMAKALVEWQYRWRLNDHSITPLGFTEAGGHKFSLGWNVAMPGTKDEEYTINQAAGRILGGSDSQADIQRSARETLFSDCGLCASLRVLCVQKSPGLLRPGRVK